MGKTVGVFHGDKARHTSAVFTERVLAEQWIGTNEFSGMLTEYPLDVSVYDLHTSTGLFTPVKDSERSREFRQNFTSASQDHWHYTNGVRG